MGINANTFESQFGTTFGRSNGNRAAANDRPKAQYWLNIGMPAPVTVEGEDSPRFISLPSGIPLDTQERLPTNSRNALFSEFQSARNDLLDQLMEFAKNLQPGDEAIIPLQIQLRRVSEEQPEVAREDNSFGVKLNLVANNG